MGYDLKINLYFNFIIKDISKLLILPKTPTPTTFKPFIT